MSLVQKPDAQAIQAHLKSLKGSTWLGPARSWWPDHLFHFTDIRNAVNILKTGELLSRTQMQSCNAPFTDGASPDVIQQTNERWKDHVRLYFRPRTPTQYSNEGFRPYSERRLGAHCPVPVYFLFDSKSVLSRVDTLFSEGSLAADTQPRGDAAAFKAIPFDKVYHDTWFDRNERGTIVYHRHAEVVVPQRLDLSALRWIWCRSQAEYQTLIHLLPPGTRRRWGGIIGTGTKLNLFFRYWSFVEKVSLEREKIVFHFNQESRTPGPFSASVEIEESLSTSRYGWKDGAYVANNVLTLSLPKVDSLTDYYVRLFLDDCLAYADTYHDEELPF